MYKEVYKWRVIDELLKGKQIYCLDRNRKQCYLVNEMFVKGLVLILGQAETDPDRFYFWEDTTEEENENG